jgi:general secretion pathway protein I
MRADGTCGFTLIEVLVALTIFVAGYVLVYQSVSLAWRGANVAWAESAAVRLAQSRLAAAGVETPLREGEQSGEAADGLRWTVRVEPYRRPGADGAFDGAGKTRRIAGYWVIVTVRWSGGVLRPARSLRLKTMKLAIGP